MIDRFHLSCRTWSSSKHFLVSRVRRVRSRGYLIHNLLQQSRSTTVLCHCRRESRFRFEFWPFRFNALPRWIPRPTFKSGVEAQTLLRSATAAYSLLSGPFDQTLHRRWLFTMVEIMRVSRTHMLIYMNKLENNSHFIHLYIAQFKSITSRIDLIQLGNCEITSSESEAVTWNYA